jgi:hypothetical protein
VHPVNYCFACKKRGQEAKWSKITDQITTPCISASEQESTKTRELAVSKIDSGSKKSNFYCNYLLM